jgi:hypothetical protein
VSRDLLVSGKDFLFPLFVTEIVPFAIISADVDALGHFQEFKVFAEVLAVLTESLLLFCRRVFSGLCPG